MNERYEALAESISVRFGDTLSMVSSRCGELTYELERADLLEVARTLRDEDAFQFSQLVDLCGIDYLAHGVAEWQTESATTTGFSRAAVPKNIVPDADTTFGHE